MRPASPLGTVLLWAMVGLTVGCGSCQEKEQPIFTKVKVEYYVPVGDHHERASREFADRQTIERLMTFFPELASGKASHCFGTWKLRANFYFARPDGEVVRVLTNFELWTAGRRGDFPVRGDLAEYVKALFEQSGN